MITGARLRLGLTQNQAGWIIGVAGATIAHWEHGRHVPHLDYMETLAAVLHLPLQELLEARQILKENLPPHVNLNKRKRPEDRIPKGPNGPCIVPGCPNRINGHGLCQTHQIRLKRKGSVMADVPIRQRKGGVCSITQCDEPVYGHGLCRAHWTRRWRHGDVGAPEILRRPSRTFTAFGETKSVPAWATDKRCLVSRPLLNWRIRRGWDPVAALTIPARTYQT